jgi:hypothetical protein
MGLLARSPPFQGEGPGSIPGSATHQEFAPVAQLDRAPRYERGGFQVQVLVGVLAGVLYGHAGTQMLTWPSGKGTALSMRRFAGSSPVVSASISKPAPAGLLIAPDARGTGDPT